MSWSHRTTGITPRTRGVSPTVNSSRGYTTYYDLETATIEVWGHICTSLCDCVIRGECISCIFWLVERCIVAEADNRLWSIFDLEGGGTEFLPKSLPEETQEKLISMSRACWVQSIRNVEDRPCLITGSPAVMGRGYSSDPVISRDHRVLVTGHQTTRNLNPIPFYVLSPPPPLSHKKWCLGAVTRNGK